MDSEYRLLPTVHEVAAATRATNATIRTKKADPDAIADLPAVNPFTQSIDGPDDFMPRDARKSEAGKLSSERQVVRVADTASLDAQSNLARARLFERKFDEFEGAWCGNLDGSIRVLHGRSPSLSVRGNTLAS
jgi:hypothetical protein